MSNRVSFSKEELSIETIMNYFELNTAALYRHKDAIKRGLVNPPLEFIGLTPTEVDSKFTQYLEELDHNCAFNLLSATEASLRIDFLNRVYERKKDELSKTFRAIYSISGNKVSLEEEILGNWKIHYEDKKPVFSSFIAALKYRHWLAHGRYWTQKFGRTYDYTNVRLICYEIDKILHPHKYAR